MIRASKWLENETEKENAERRSDPCEIAFL